MSRARSVHSSPGAPLVHVHRATALGARRADRQEVAVGGERGPEAVAQSRRPSRLSIPDSAQRSPARRKTWTAPAWLAGNGKADQGAGPADQDLVARDQRRRRRSRWTPRMRLGTSGRRRERRS